MGSSDGALKIKGAMRACWRNQAQRDRRPATNRLEKLRRPVALVLGGEETLPAALPGDVHATGTRVELALPERQLNSRRSA